MALLIKHSQLLSLLPRLAFKVFCPLTHPYLLVLLLEKNGGFRLPASHVHSTFASLDPLLGEEAANF